MSIITVAFAAAALLAVVLVKYRSSALDQAVSASLASRALEPILTELEKLPPGRQATAFNSVVKGLWNAYERDLAVGLIRQAAGGLSDARIVQFWIRTALEVEPGLARQAFDGAFLGANYKPEVAAGCGKGGCGGH